MDVMRIRKRPSSEFRAWGISLAVHILLFLLIGASGFFLLVREQPHPSEDEVVDITMLDDMGGGGSESAPSAVPASSSAAETPAIALPSETKLPEIAETYTKEPERQEEYRQERQAATASSSVASDASDRVGKSAGNGSAAEGAGSDSGVGIGSGTGSGDGIGSGTGNGSGAGAGNGRDSTAPAQPPEPVDAGAYCTYRAAPAYPQSMVQAGAQGSVTVLITVSPASAVTDVSVVSSSGYPALDAAAVAAGWACRFQMNGHPGRYRTTYRFELRGGDDDW